MALKLAGSGDTLTIKDDELGVANPDADVSYIIRVITREDYKRLHAAQTKRRPNPRTHVMEDVTDWPAVSEDMLDFVLVGWTGILWDGQPAACDREYKLKLDSGRAAQLLQVAGMNQIAQAPEQRAQSFRPPA